MFFLFLWWFANERLVINLKNETMKFPKFNINKNNRRITCTNTVPHNPRNTINTIELLYRSLVGFRTLIRIVRRLKYHTYCFSFMGLYSKGVFSVEIFRSRYSRWNVLTEVIRNVFPVGYRFFVKIYNDLQHWNKLLFDVEARRGGRVVVSEQSYKVGITGTWNFM